METERGGMDKEEKGKHGGERNSMQQKGEVKNEKKTREDCALFVIAFITSREKRNRPSFTNLY